ncbi:class I adenylate-forming enzyme family protein [Bacillus sp. SM2101]|uniref:class I adenylate-forming enzyme family protein n=1 Tax=Bacillus sp. SM2101 TaxID=2805366 RepID=UPI001BDF684C|nr:class I adenylate-forming enzyme family protein [Bacillus sp. SM2101]
MDILNRIDNSDNQICIRLDQTSVSYKDIHGVTKINQLFIKKYIRVRETKGQPVVFVDTLLGWKLIPIYLACMEERITVIPVDFANSPNLSKKILSEISGLLIKSDHVDDKGRLKEVSLNNKIINYKILDDVAFVLYTSGTTQRPKGVMLTYNNIISNAEQIIERLQVSKEDRLLIVRPLFYASSITGEIFSGLLSGSSFVFKDYLKSPLQSIKLVEKHKINSMFLTPSLMVKLLQMRNKGHFKSLKKLVLSGERLYFAQYLNIAQSLPSNVQIYNAYGLTEASPRISIEHIHDSFQEASVGYPLNNVKTKITNRHGRKVPKGEKGYLHVKGPNVMKGYFRQKRLTEKMINDGWLNTNDIASIIEDRLYIYGRADNTFIRNGVNIQLEEIEELLRSTPYVEDTIVVKEEKNNKLYEIIAKIVPTNIYDQVLLRKEIQKWDKKLWPDRIIIHQDMPNTMTGKLSRLTEKNTE